MITVDWIKISVPWFPLYIPHCSWFYDPENITRYIHQDYKYMIYIIWYTHNYPLLYDIPIIITHYVSYTDWDVDHVEVRRSDLGSAFNSFPSGHHLLVNLVRFTSGGPLKKHNTAPIRWFMYIYIYINYIYIHIYIYASSMHQLCFK